MKDSEEIIGHDDIINHLKNAINTKKVSHSYIFCGEEGMGKRMIAKKFARTLQCERASDEPCGECKSCKQAISGNHPDIMWITHEKKSIGVDDVRNQINGDIIIKPYSSKYKIYIIDFAEKMTQVAQNALLKTIEEPPPYGIVLLLVSNINALLPTIISRCVSLNLKPIDGEQIRQYLIHNYDLPDYLAQVATSFCGGNLGKAIRYATSEEFIQIKDDTIHLLRRIDNIEVHEVMETVKNISKNKTSVHDYIDLIILWYRDVLTFKASKNLELILFKEESQYIEEQASNRSYEDIENIISSTNRTKQRLKTNVNFDIAIELMLLTMKENCNG